MRIVNIEGVVQQSVVVCSTDISGGDGLPLLAEHHEVAAAHRGGEPRSSFA